MILKTLTVKREPPFLANVGRLLFAFFEAFGVIFCPDFCS